MDSRVIQNFKHEKFTWDPANAYSLTKEMLKNVKIIKIGPHLRVPIEYQSFTT